MATYSYDPENITSGGVDQMRFELGDTITEQGAIASPLCNEEYTAIIEQQSTWKRAKAKCLEAIMMKLAYEVDTSVGGLSYSLSARAERWREMYKEAKKDALAAAAIPKENPKAISPTPGIAPYYYNDLQTNPRKF